MKSDSLLSCLSDLKVKKKALEHFSISTLGTKEQIKEGISLIKENVKKLWEEFTKLNIQSWEVEN